MFHCWNKIICDISMTWLVKIYVELLESCMQWRKMYFVSSDEFKWCLWPWMSQSILLRISKSRTFSESACPNRSWFLNSNKKWLRYSRLRDINLKSAEPNFLHHSQWFRAERGFNELNQEVQYPQGGWGPALTTPHVQTNYRIWVFWENKIFHFRVIS